MRLSPPAVDDGAGGGLTMLWRELEPTPGRLANTLRLVALVLGAVAISETFRLPDPAVSAYIVLFVSRSERSSTVTTAVVAGAALILGTLATILIFMLSLSEPALRVPLIAAATFVAIFLSRITPLGPAAFAAGFVMAYGLTLGDQLLGLSLQGAIISNTTGFSLPEILFVSPEEALLRFMLWLAVVVAMPVALVVVVNLLTGREPGAVLQDALAARLAAAARFCARVPGAGAVLALQAQEGAGALEMLRAGCDDAKPGRNRRRIDWLANPSLTAAAGQLAPLLLAWTRVSSSGARDEVLREFGAACRRAQHAIQSGRPKGTRPEPLPAFMPAPDSATAAPLAAELSQCMLAIDGALSASVGVRQTSPKASPKPARHLIAADAWTNPDYPRFALKVTLAVMLCYVGESLAAWPQVHTAVVTCFFVSLGTVGESVHKATLRVVGATIGGALGIGTILWLMPFMTEVTDLLAAIAAVTFVASWIACGSERIGYAGLQIGFAYYLAILQGYGPTLDMQTARDRVIGILIGNATVFLVFTTIWPASIAQPVRRAVAKAIGQLGTLMALETKPAALDPAVEAGPRQAFATAIGNARALLANAGFEQAAILRPVNPRPIDAAIVTEVQNLLIPLEIIFRLGLHPAWQAAPRHVTAAAAAYHQAMAEWFGRASEWVTTGARGRALLAELPSPPALVEPEESMAPEIRARQEWYRILHHDITAILEEVMPADAGVSAPQETAFAAI